MFSTVKVVVALDCASAFCNSALPKFKKKIKAKINTPDNAVNTVIFPAVSTNRGSSCLLYDIIIYLFILSDIPHLMPKLYTQF